MTASHNYPFDWYWRADDDRLFSSLRQELVALDDLQFEIWCGKDQRPSAWPRDDAGEQTNAALQEVLTPHAIYVDLDALKLGLQADIDVQAEARRLQYITPGAGQAQEYQEVYQEAVAAAGDPAVNDPPGPVDVYPLLRAGIGVDLNPATGNPITTVAEAAAVVIATAERWKIVAATIRSTRLAAKRAVDAAADKDSARAAAAVVWPV